MWQLDWGQQPAKEYFDGVSRLSSVDINAISHIYLLHWTEHCVECAIPDCYKICALYTPRKDKKCARFNYGIYSNADHQGLYPYGADISFKRWAKLESELGFGAAGISRVRWLDRVDRLLQIIVNFFGSLLAPINKKRRINGLYYYLRRLFIEWISSIDEGQNVYDEFLMDVWNPSDRDVQIIIECEQETLCYRESITLKPGHSLHKIDFNAMNIDLSKRNGRIRLYPDNDDECRLVFSWLDFVKYDGDSEQLVPTDAEVVSVQSGATANKIKSVIWDLDNTIWDGVLGELGKDGVKVNSHIVDFIKTLDKRGIIQSIASKNDYQHAWDALTGLELDKYFLYPAINWEPKSENIKQIAKQLNINVDTFAFIDDSQFERAQVKSELPTIRVYDPAKLHDILEMPEFDVSFTEESKNRRNYYQAEIQRKGFSIEATGDYDAFLRQCNMQAEIFSPKCDEDILRCLELLQRSNQLNLTTHRYDKGEFQAATSSPSVLTYATKVSDRFGEYGIVGVATIDISEQVPLLCDFVLSCRVAQKKIEHAWFASVANILREKGHSKLHAIFLPTERNHILLEVMRDVGFYEMGEVDGGMRLELDFNQDVPESDIVNISIT